MFPLAGLLLLAASAPPLPRLMLWAWERPEDLRFLDPSEAGVAFLASTLLLTGDTVEVRPRLQPLRVPEGAALMAVVRIESRHARLSARQRQDALAAILEVPRTTRTSALQIDFDARASERGFYRALILELRRRTPAYLSITALASWCAGGGWLAGLPVDEAVPMLFRMGGTRGPAPSAPICAGAIGISTDEPRPPIPPRARVYIFHPRPWTPLAWRAILAEVRGAR